jgi:site-specific DNA-methyltransferase (adenine-specific)
MNKVIQGDCLEVMKDIPDKSVDMILCDLPYGTTKNKWDSIIPFKPLWEQYKRIIKDNGAIVLTSAQPFTTSLINSNREMFRYDLIFEKTLGSGFLNAKRMPMRYHEEVLLFYKKLPVYNPIMGEGVRKKGINKSKDNGSNYGKKTKFDYEYDDEGTRYPKSIIKFSTGNRTKNQFHPTQKPVALFEYLIKTYTNEGDLVLDNCAGSGTTGVACKNTNRSYILIEKEPEYIEIINKRLNQ